jgi:hypothetical protein
MYFGDPKITAADDSPHGEALLARLLARVIFMLPSGVGPHEA